MLDSAAQISYNAMRFEARVSRTRSFAWPASHSHVGPPQIFAQVAQLVEHATENRSVGGSIPPLGTISQSRS